MKLMPWVIDFLKPPPKWQIIKSSFAKVIAGQKKYLFTEISEVLSDLDDNFLLWCNRKCQLYFGLWTLVFLEKMDCNQITKCSVVGYSWRRRGWAFQMCVCGGGGGHKNLAWLSISKFCLAAVLTQGGGRSFFFCECGRDGWFHPRF